MLLIQVQIQKCRWNLHVAERRGQFHDAANKKNSYRTSDIISEWFCSQLAVSHRPIPSKLHTNIQMSSSITALYPSFISLLNSPNPIPDHIPALIFLFFKHFIPFLLIKQKIRTLHKTLQTSHKVGKNKHMKHNILRYNIWVFTLPTEYLLYRLNKHIGPHYTASQEVKQNYNSQTKSCTARIHKHTQNKNNIASALFLLFTNSKITTAGSVIKFTNYTKISNWKSKGINSCLFITWVNVHWSHGKPNLTLNQVQKTRLLSCYDNAVTRCWLCSFSSEHLCCDVVCHFTHSIYRCHFISQHFFEMLHTSFFKTSTELGSICHCLPQQCCTKYHPQDRLQDKDLKTTHDQNFNVCKLQGSYKIFFLLALSSNV